MTVAERLGYEASPVAVGLKLITERLGRIAEDVQMAELKAVENNRCLDAGSHLGPRGRHDDSTI